MSKIFGIRFNHWHGILAFVVIVLVSRASWEFMNPALIEANNALVGFFCWVIGLTVALALQGLNESLQMLSEKSINRHGGYEGFVADSKQDWRFFVLGALLGTIIAFFWIAHL